MSPLSEHSARHPSIVGHCLPIHDQHACPSTAARHLIRFDPALLLFRDSAIADDDTFTLRVSTEMRCRPNCPSPLLPNPSIHRLRTPRPTQRYAPRGGPPGPFSTPRDFLALSPAFIEPRVLTRTVAPGVRKQRRTSLAGLNSASPPRACPPSSTCILDRTGQPTVYARSHRHGVGRPCGTSSYGLNLFNCLIA